MKTYYLIVGTEQDTFKAVVMVKSEQEMAESFPTASSIKYPPWFKVFKFEAEDVSEVFCGED